MPPHQWRQKLLYTRLPVFACKRVDLNYNKMKKSVITSFLCLCLSLFVYLWVSNLNLSKSMSVLTRQSRLSLFCLVSAICTSYAPPVSSEHPPTNHRYGFVCERPAPCYFSAVKTVCPSRQSLALGISPQVSYSTVERDPFS